MDDFWNVLIPGDGDWPSAAAAIADFALVEAALSPDDRAWLQSVSAQVLGSGDRVAAMQAWEGAADGPFSRMLHALYAIYYTTPAVHAVIERLADRGPQEASDVFDETLLQQVIRTQAGKRRL